MTTGREQLEHALRMFLDIDPTFTSASLKIVKEMAADPKNKMARAVLAARLSLGEELPYEGLNS
jgi:hypothetical protein